jgi:hypothetical protein
MDKVEISKTTMKSGIHYKNVRVYSFKNKVITIEEKKLRFTNKQVSIQFKKSKIPLLQAIWIDDHRQSKWGEMSPISLSNR